MHFAFTSLSIVLASTLTAVAQTAVPTILNYDDRFCRSAERMNTACGPQLNTKWPTFGNVPNFPAIGGGFPIEPFNSTKCGTCWEVTHIASGRSIAVTLVEYAPAGFNLCAETVEELTGIKRSEWPGNVPVTVKQAPTSACGI